MIKKEKHFYEIMKIISDLDPENQKNLANMLEKDAEELRVNLAKLVENALKTMVEEKPNINLIHVYDKVKTKNALVNDNEIQNKELEELLASCNDLLAEVGDVGKRRAS